MSQYTCLNCGFVFDEEKGLSGKRMAPNWNALLKSGCGWHKGSEQASEMTGIEAGTKWSDVPEEFTCPSCGKEKDWFE